MTKTTNNNSTTHPGDPPTTKFTKYRIAIKQPEDWKIHSIAQWKKKQKIRKQIELQKQQLMKAAIPPPRLELSPEGEDRKKSSKKMLSSQTIKENAERQKQEEELKNTVFESNTRELANCHINSTLIKSRIAALHSVRMSLLWLLKKTSLHERAIINDHLAPLNAT
jgi:hypothetical protein